MQVIGQDIVYTKQRMFAFRDKAGKQLVCVLLEVPVVRAPVLFEKKIRGIDNKPHRETGGFCGIL